MKSRTKMIRWAILKASIWALFEYDHSLNYNYFNYSYIRLIKKISFYWQNTNTRKHNGNTMEFTIQKNFLYHYKWYFLWFLLDKWLISNVFFRNVHVTLTTILWNFLLFLFFPNTGNNRKKGNRKKVIHFVAVTQTRWEHQICIFLMGKAWVRLQLGIVYVLLLQSFTISI